MPSGRLSSYTDEIADEICERIANGESLREICRLEGFPHAGTVCRWLADDRYASFREQYARAREIQADVLADEILAIANSTEFGEVVTDKPTGREIRTADMIEHRRLKIDARKWFAGKVAPKKYGDKSSLEMTGKDGGPIETKDESGLDVARKIAFLLAKADKSREIS